MNCNKDGYKDCDKGQNRRNEVLNDKEKTPITRRWNVKDDILAAMRRSANKFAVLGNVSEDVIPNDPVNKEHKEV